MEFSQRALYNSLRMNWVLDPTLEVESWQVEDYRAMPLDVIFEKLEDKGVHLDKTSFLAYAESVESPEELTDALLADIVSDAKVHDQAYLLIFEAWRRLLPEKPCLSIFCDELDYQIYLYDRGQVESPEAIQDVLANLQVVLDENLDNGADPVEAFECIDAACANDVESFLYDFIAEQIENRNYTYGIELLDGFSNYVRDLKWFDFLRAQIMSAKSPVEANRMIIQLLQEEAKDPDVTFILEVLSFLVPIADKETFDRLVKQTASQIKVEEDFQSLVSICADFYHRLDRDPIEEALQEILNKRAKIDLNRSFDPKDPHFSEFFKIIA